MSKMSKYHETLRKMSELSKELELLESDKELKAEREFIEKLHLLVADYDLTPRTALETLGLTSGQGSVLKDRKKRKQSAFRNPHSGERVAGTKRSTIIAAWIKQYGESVVEGWRE